MENKAVRRLVAYESYKEPSYNIGWQVINYFFNRILYSKMKMFIRHFFLFL